MSGTLSHSHLARKLVSDRAAYVHIYLDSIECMALSEALSLEFVVGESEGVVNAVCQVITNLILNENFIVAEY